MDPRTRHLDQSESKQTSPRCPKCDSDTIMAVPWSRSCVILVKSFDWLRIPLRRTSCRAVVCTRCGFTEFYATDPTKLLEP
jgi:predicted nucleic-acid-binding Zn-ribbon protein